MQYFKIASVRCRSPFFDLWILSLISWFWIWLKRSYLRSKRFLVFYTHKRICLVFILPFMAKCSLMGFSKRNPRSFPPSTIKSVTLTWFLINEFKVTICKCNTREKEKDLVLLEQNKVQVTLYMGVFSPILFRII